VKFREILKYFYEDFLATTTANLTGISRSTVNRIYKLLRVRIVEISLAEARELGDFELDESCLGVRRVRGKRGRGAAGKTSVFRILKTEGKVFVNVDKIVPEKSLYL